MAMFDNTRKNGIQLGTVGDRCMECDHKHRMDEDYEPQRLDYQPVYKFWINNLSHCMCMNCFMESLGDYILLSPQYENKKVEDKDALGDYQLLNKEEDKPKKKNNSKKKEVDKDGETK